MIDRGLLACGKSVSFELSLGNAGNRKFSKEQAQKEDDEEEETAGGEKKEYAHIYIYTRIVYRLFALTLVD